MVGASALNIAGKGGEDDASRLASVLREHYAPADCAQVERALAWAAPRLERRLAKSGESALSHALKTAVILQEIKLDADCIAASLLAPLVEEREAVRAMREQFGDAITDLAEGVARMVMVESLGSRAALAAQGAEQMEGLRKMLLAMAQDVRVVLVKLADHMQTMRYVVRASDEARRNAMARLAWDIFAPLANRLGVWQLKWELEDLALRILDPDNYRRIAGLLDETRQEREQYIESVKARLRDELARAGIKAEVSGRPKHIYSIYNKMRRKSVDFDALYDVRAVRVLVNDLKECYTALGIAHNLWTPLPGEFDDYIAKPKNNDYRSLHTAVIGPAGKPLEIQIRTFDMHQHAELGVAAHWRYKEGSRHDASYDEKIVWLRHIVSWKDEVADAGDLATQFRSELFADTIYVLTPQGRVIDLPKGATPIDFAYHVHTELGHRCRGAKVGGVMVSLSTALKNGQQVEIIAAKQGGPSRDWLNPALGFVKSAASRTKVRQWFNRQNYEAAVAQGREIVEKELQREGKTGINLDKFAQRLGFDKLADMLAEVGRGELGARQLHTVLRADDAPAAPVDLEPLVRKSRAQPGGILVVGVDRLLTVPAKCCKPAPPDAIIGFVSRGRGVTIHRKSCANVQRLDAERLMPADWGSSPEATFPVDVVIDANDRTGLLRDITEILSREHINVTATNSISRDAAATMLLTVEINHLAQLQRVLGLIKEVPGVARASRR